MDFAMVLAEVMRFLNERGLRYGIAGGHAVNAYGIARATSDLDLIVDDAAREPLLVHLAKLGYELLQPPAGTLTASDGFSNHIHRDARWGRLDFIYLDKTTARMFSLARRGK
ncbi:MAG TPA: hypothetical protein VH083_16505 [Myxococcales bacterium]|nr:hypothetical protein [Myxococcales bacterium]